MIADILFYTFASALTLGAVGVVAARNPMYSVLWLIFAFFNASGLFLLLGAEFLGLLLIMVYVGAVAVMFLFVLMTINIEISEIKRKYPLYLPLGCVVALLLAVELFMAVSGGLFSGELSANPSLPAAGTGENIVGFGHALFTSHVLPFQLAGVILLIAMIGAIVLTARERKVVKKQNIAEQITRKRSDSYTLTQPEVGQGVTISHFTLKASK